MFDRFTDRSRRVMALARKEAQKYNHDFIGTEHILLGLLDQKDATAAGALRGLGLKLEDVRAEVLRLFGED